MASFVVLDTSVLLPAPLRDTLLRLAEAELFVPKWSRRILDELSRNLVKAGRSTPEQADRLVQVMQEAFEDAEVSETAISALEPAMTNDPKDRHVLAAAVASGAQVIATHNLADFPVEACQPLGVDALHPDHFLCDLYHLDPQIAVVTISEQAADLSRPKMSTDEVLDCLRADAPRFAELIRKIG